MSRGKVRCRDCCVCCIFRLKIDLETAEAMIGHKKRGLVEIYDRYDMLDEKREGFRRWEAKLVAMAREAGVAEALGIPA